MKDKSSLNIPNRKLTFQFHFLMSDDAKYYVLATKTKRLIGNGSIDAEIYTTHLNIYYVYHSLLVHHTAF